MAISPNAPEYVGQVRGILGDLRENYLKKQQLYLQEKEQTERMELARAQLNLQAQTAADATQLAQTRLAAEASQAAAQVSANKSRYDSELFKAQQAALKEAVVQDREERKFKFDLDKEDRELKKEQEDREKEFESGRLMQEGTVAMNSDDPTKLIEWTNKLAGSILSQKQRNDVYTNALSLVDAKKRLEQDAKNIETQPTALGVVQNLNMLDVSQYTPETFAFEIKKHTDEFKALGNTDPILNDAFMSISQEVAKRQNDFMQKDYGKAYSNFLNDAVLGELNPADQKEWDSLQQKYPNEIDRGQSTDYANATKRLMFQSNKRKSIEELTRMENANQVRAENLASKDSALAVVKVDPQTNEQYRSFIFPTPDLTPRVGYDGTIDPNTGLITKRALDENKKFVDEVTSPAFPYGSPNMMKMLMSGQGGLSIPPTTTAPSGGPGSSTTAAIPFRPNSGTKFDSVGVPGAAKIVTASPATAPEISPETINNIVTAYRANPEAMIYGRPAREIIAVLRSKGYSVPDALATPGQTR